jgi:hypothetical protein
MVQLVLTGSTQSIITQNGTYTVSWNEGICVVYFSAGVKEIKGLCYTRIVQYVAGDLSKLRKHHSPYVVVHVDGVRLCLWAAATKRLLVHPPHDIWVCSPSAIILNEETKKLGEKPVPVPLSPPQIPHGLTRAQTQAPTSLPLWQGMNKWLRFLTA